MMKEDDEESVTETHPEATEPAGVLEVDLEGRSLDREDVEIQKVDDKDGDATVNTSSYPSTRLERIRVTLRSIGNHYFWNRRDYVLANITIALLFGTWGILAGYWTPRGPLTVGQATASTVLNFCLGFPTGYILRSKWPMAWLPAVFLLFLEVMRARLSGPTVDKVRLRGSIYGLVAFASGRCVHYLFSLIPMILGLAYGYLFSRWVLHNKPPNQLPTGGSTEKTRNCAKCCKYFGYLVLAVVSILSLTIFIAILIPAKTDEISGENSIAELTSTNVNGKDLALMIRGADKVENPVLLFLAGGPGGSELGAMRNHLESLEISFTVVTWDQRGCGKSYAALDPTDSISLDGYISDTLALTDVLRERFHKDQIYLLGQSWGSLLGLLAVDRDTVGRYAAYIGAGQMVAPKETDQLMYEGTLDWAIAEGKSSLVDDLRSIGPPPYDQILDYEDIFVNINDVYPYDHSLNSEGEHGFSENTGVREYNWLQAMHLYAALIDTFSILYPRIQDVDLRPGRESIEVTQFTVPLFFVQGAHEVPGRSEPFQEWYSSVSAPYKELVIFNTSGHRPLFEQPELFVEYMVGTVLNMTSGTFEN